MMNETTVQSAHDSDAVRDKIPFSYCCECGTYDAHTTMCSCCGFDFRHDTARGEDE